MVKSRLLVYNREVAGKELQEMVDLGILAVRGTGQVAHYVLVRDWCAIVRDY